jgi:hypothetical protein
MKISYAPEANPFHRDIYEINMVCSFDKIGAKLKSNYQFYVKPDEIEKTILEIECIANQFEHGRAEIDNRIFNQTKFFLKDKDNFTWFYQYPRDMADSNNLHLLSYEVSYYDKNQVKQKVEISEIDNFLINLRQLNHESKMGTYFWEEEATKKDADAYFYDLVQLIHATILTEKLEAKLEKKSDTPKKKI